MATKTELIYKELQKAYDFFNRHLFGGQLPSCVITLQRRARSYGYVAGKRWNSRTGSMTDDIVLNPDLFSEEPPQVVLATLVHEMTHVWQHHFGKPSRMGYHNREWANKMMSIGLCPSDTGQPGGKRTGQRMSHYVIEAGRFEQTSRELLRQISLTSWHRWSDEIGPDDSPIKKVPSRLKYSCIGCGLNAWAKPNISIYCGTCELELLASR